jgi:hypothetical protein
MTLTFLFRYLYVEGQNSHKMLRAEQHYVAF